jgi:glycosyltransferase involved in cell wall biosynthesis
MSNPLVSVIIPAYNQADFLGAAIASVLEQSYSNVEAIVVDDVSPDHTADVVRSFNDPRLHYIVHDRNRMLAAARNTGMRAARGEIFALLDADDYFDKKKIAMHVEFLRQNPDVGVSYNGRYDLQCRGEAVRNIVRVPATVLLRDLVLGFPFNPSDMVLRREWAFAVDLFDESYIHFSEDLDINCRLALAGCKFGGVDRCLNYRRFHAGRVIRNSRQRLDGSVRALDNIFADPRTPLDVHALKGRAYANNYVVWGVNALDQFDTGTGLEYLRQAVHYSPGLLLGNPNELTVFLLYHAIHDEAADHPKIYREIVAQLPSEFAAVNAQMEWGIGRGWLVKAYRLLIWGSREEGRACLRSAVKAGAVIDEQYLRDVVYQLRGCEIEHGAEVACEAACQIDKELRMAIPGSNIPSFAAAMQLASAFEYYNAGRNDAVPSQVLRAFRMDPRNILNRGALSILVRSALQARLGVTKCMQPAETHEEL